MDIGSGEGAPKPNPRMEPFYKKFPIGVSESDDSSWVAILSQGKNVPFVVRGNYGSESAYKANKPYAIYREYYGENTESDRNSDPFILADESVITYTTNEVETIQLMKQEGKDGATRKDELLVFINDETKVFDQLLVMTDQHKAGDFAKMCLTYIDDAFDHLFLYRKHNDEMGLRLQSDAIELIRNSDTINGRLTELDPTGNEFSEDNDSAPETTYIDQSAVGQIRYTISDKGTDRERIRIEVDVDTALGPGYDATHIFEFSTHLDIKKIAQRLNIPLLADHPTDEEPTVDLPWRNADLVSTVGLRWTDHLPQVTQ